MAYTKQLGDIIAPAPTKAGTRGYYAQSMSEPSNQDVLNYARKKGLYPNIVVNGWQLQTFPMRRVNKKYDYGTAWRHLKTGKQEVRWNFTAPAPIAAPKPAPKPAPEPAPAPAPTTNTTGPLVDTTPDQFPATAKAPTIGTVVGHWKLSGYSATGGIWQNIITGAVYKSAGFDLPAAMLDVTYDTMETTVPTSGNDAPAYPEAQTPIFSGPGVGFPEPMAPSLPAEVGVETETPFSFAAFAAEHWLWLLGGGIGATWWYANRRKRR